MASDVELRKIKKKYGERFMHMCRELFPTTLEEEGALLGILEKTFANNSRSLYEDIHNNHLEEEFKKLIYSKIDVEEEKDEITEEKTPYELLDEAGYSLYECKNEEDIQKFEKYYANGEKLCTFNGNRLNSCVVFFAVRKNVDEINREDFIKPEREDEYGTSVMSIQFWKTGICRVSIKNRYNHRVNNPDATYGNDLDRIIPGLSKSFEKLLLKRGLQFGNSNIERFSIPNYVVAGDGKYYKYNMEIHGRYYCPGNVIIDGGYVVKLKHPEKQILVENFVVDMENKIIKSYINETIFADLYDAFPDTFRDSIERIQIVRDKGTKKGERIIRVKKKDTEARIEIRINRDNQIIEYVNEELEGVRENFLRHNTKVRRLILPNLKNAGDYFLSNNRELEYLELPKLRVAHRCFLFCNQKLTSLDLPELIQAKDSFLYNNTEINHVSLPKLEKAGDSFLGCNEHLKILKLPCLREADNNFLTVNCCLEYLFAPNLSTVGRDFLYYNSGLEELELPSLTKVGIKFLRYNDRIRHLVVGDPKILENTENKRLLIIQKSLITPRLLAKLDKNRKITEFEIKLIGKFMKMRNLRDRDK